jgi:hypothetical protein
MTEKIKEIELSVEFGILLYSHRGMEFASYINAISQE